MTAVYTRQYRPLAAMADNHALAVADFYELAASINNAKHYALVPKLLSTLTAVDIVSREASTDEVLVLPPFAPRYLSPGYVGFRWFLHGALEAGATGTTTWKLYAHAGLYRGSSILDITKVYAGYKASSIEFTSTSPSIKTALLTLSTTTVPGAGRTCVDGKSLVWFLLTAQNSDATTQCKIKMLDGWPRL